MVEAVQDTHDDAGGCAGDHFHDEQGPRCLVVMYHYVRDDDPATRADGRPERSGICGLTSDAFRDQIDRLCAAFEPVDWPTLFAWSCRRRSIPRRSFLLTFDDGLAEHAQTVVPILEQRGLHGAFFIPGAVLASHQMLSAHALHVLLSKLSEERLEREVVDLLDGEVETVSAEKAQQMYHYESPARARLKYLLTTILPVHQRSVAITRLFERYVGSSAEWAKRWYLGWDELAHMQSAGHTVGAHGFCHEPYTRLSPTEKRRDLRQVLSLLSDGLGPDIRPISYPYGSFDGDTLSACAEVGFAHGFTTRRGWIRAGDDLLTLSRVDTIDVGSVVQEEAACQQA